MIKTIHAIQTSEISTEKNEIQTLPNSEMNFFCGFAIFYRHFNTSVILWNIPLFSRSFKIRHKQQMKTTLTRRAFTQNMLLYFTHRHARSLARMLNDFESTL